MRVVVTGAAGQTGQLVVSALVAAGHDVLGIVRRPEQGPGLELAGASARLADLTELAPTEWRALMDGVDGVVWAAGAGFGGDPQAVDGEACIAAQQAADADGVERWVQISSMYADRPEEGPEFLRPVLRAKGTADASLTLTAMGWSVVRPGGLTNDVATGQVYVGRGLTGGMIGRADLASVAVACLSHRAASRQAFDVVSGRTPVADALDSLAADA
jgi:uncharacterized protein YbjT (DUF2867 family)